MNPPAYVRSIQLLDASKKRQILPAIGVVALLAVSGCQSFGSNNPEQFDTKVTVNSRTYNTELTEAHNSGEPLHTSDLANSLTSPNSYDGLWLSTIHTDFKVAKALVEQELDVDLSNVMLHVVNNAPINAEVVRETERLVSSQFGTGAFAEDFLQQVMHPLDGTYAALYSSHLSSILISGTMLNNYEQGLDASLPASAKHAALMVLLIHELVHAADDKRYRIHDNRALNFRASFAQSATFEGHAQWVTRQICEKSDCVVGLELLDQYMFNTNHNTNAQVQSVDAISRNVLEYSYIEGERFISALAERSNGKRLLDDVLSMPPQDPIQILAPASFPDIAREYRNQTLIQASRNVDHEFARKPWIGVETSPLKGVDLRSDPVRRQAAVDGFTLLINSMVSMQFYNQEVFGASPIEATILQAENPQTASLFANMLHGNTQQYGAQVNDERLKITTSNTHDSDTMSVHVYRTAIDADSSYRTTIVASGPYVVQISGNTKQQELLEDYAIKTLINLNSAPV